jgi:MFS family permease
MNCIKQKYESFCFQWKRESFRKGISTLIGAIIMNFLNGAIFSLCTLAVYEISYIKEKGGSIEIEHLTFYYPIELLFQCISAFFSGILYKKMGLHATNLIGVTLLVIAYFTMYLSNHLVVDLLSMILGGIGTGVILYPSTTNAYEWFPLNNGIIVGIMETMISFGSFFWSFIGEKIINSEETPSNDETSLYSMDIAIKMKMYLMIQIIGWVVAYILSFLLMYERSKFNMDIQIDIKSEEGHLFNNKTAADPNSTFSEFFLTDNEENLNYDENYLESGKVLANKKIKGNKNEKKEEKSRKDSLHKKKKEDDSHLGLFDMDLSLKAEDFENDDDEEKEVSLKFLLKFTLKSKRLILFIVILIMQAPVSNMAFSLYREIGEYNKVEPKYLQLVGSLYFIFECLSSFVFGLLCDYFRLKFLLLFINIVGTIVGFTYCLTFKNGLIFFFVQNFLSFSAGGYYPVKDCYLMKVFGKDIYIELSAFVSFLVSIAINLLTPITYVITGFEDKNLGYWILFISFGVINLVGTFLNFFLSETPIDKKDMFMDIDTEKNVVQKVIEEEEGEQKEENLEDE